MKKYEYLIFVLLFCRIKLNAEMAKQATDSLSQLLFDDIFNQIVRQMNLCVNKKTSTNYIGILDIAGFGENLKSKQ